MYVTHGRCNETTSSIQPSHRTNVIPKRREQDWQETPNEMLAWCLAIIDLNCYVQVTDDARVSILQTVRHEFTYICVMIDSFQGERLFSTLGVTLHAKVLSCFITIFHFNLYFTDYFYFCVFF